MKVCSKCRVAKPVEAFHVDRSRADGRGYVCRVCRNPPRADGHPTRPERIAARFAGKRYCRHCRLWHDAADVTKQGTCRAHEAAEARARYAADESYRHRRKARVIARRRGVLPMPEQGAAYRLELFFGECAYCPDRATTWDHVVPIASGGQTTADNVVPACVRCNSSKRDREVWSWLESTGRLAFVDHGKLDQLVMLAEC